MNIVQVLILLTLSPAYLCQDVNNLFKNINDRVLTFNARSADIAWKSSIEPGNPDLPRKAAVLQKERIHWDEEVCGKLETLIKSQLMNSLQARQMYLLCRGPKFTFHEAREISNIYEELQTIYTEAEICVPSQENTTVNPNPIDRVESAILQYIINLQIPRNNKEDMVDTAAKIAINEEVKQGVCLKGEDDFENVMKLSRNEAVLKWTWLGWREKVAAMKEPYRRLVNFENVGARRNGYQDIGSAWRDELETPHLRQFCRRLYDEVKPLYTLLHGVVRYYLRRHYGEIVPERGPIPAHLLGNLWSQNWETLTNLITTKTIDLDQSITNLNWTVLDMVKKAEDFYQSFGLPAMTDTFWEKSVFVRENKHTRCHGTAADMFKDDDFRLLYCSGTTKDDFYVLHHEMGHIQYYMAYEKQPALFRQANTALHESIGDAIMYGVMTPQHLHRLGLINDTLLYINTAEQADEVLTEKEKGLEEFNNIEDKGFYIENTDKDKVEDNFIEKIDATKDVNKGFNRRKYRDINKHKRFKGFENIINKNSFYNEYSDKNKVDDNVFEKKDVAKEINKDLIERRHRKHNIHKRFEEFENIIDKNVYSEGNDNAFKTDDILILKQALNKIPQIPFSLLIDEYRWKYFEGSISRADTNKVFWEMAVELQGIAPNTERGEEFFDIGAKFHVPDNTPYIRYFLSSFLQLQLFESLCKAAVFGRRDDRDAIPDTIPLHRCDIYGSKAAGKLLRDVMSKGHSQHWRQILQQATGENDISASSLQRYYRPLYDVLMKLVRKHKIPIGWKEERESFLDR